MTCRLKLAKKYNEEQFKEKKKKKQKKKRVYAFKTTKAEKGFQIHI